MADFTPTLKVYGPRVKEDQVFDGKAEGEGAVPDDGILQNNFVLEMDEPELVWTETLDENAPYEQSFGSIAFAFHLEDNSEDSIE
jgi:hypothetical protein